MREHGAASGQPAEHAEPADDRHETFTERMDRNWDELLQELRVTQTGAQILTGFLLTVPFQQRFGDLDDYQRDLYLILVVLAVVATGLIVAPASLHRVMFRKRLKRQLVEAGDVLARLGLVALALTMAGSAMLVFDVVAGRAAGRIVGAAALVVLGGCWWLLPVGLVRHARTSGSDEKTATAPDHAGPGPS